MYGDLSRPPLNPAALARAMLHGGSVWTDLQVVQSTGSTNADLVAAARAGAPAGSVLVAEHQGGGRGRLDRGWVSPPQAGLTFSMLLRPGVAAARWGWLPLLVGVALAEAVSTVGEVPARLKWPNDLLLGQGRQKAAGILAEVVDDAVVVGIGLNVSTRAGELPPGATSLALLGSVCTDRDTVLRSVLRSVDVWFGTWNRAEGDAVGSGVLSAYVEVCDTLGREVAVALPDGTTLRGRAEAIDSAGRLLVRAAGVLHPLAAGDVTHVRPD